MMLTNYTITSTEAGSEDVTHGFTRKQDRDDILRAAMRKYTGKRYDSLHVQHFTGGGTYHVQGYYGPAHNRNLTPVHVIRLYPVDEDDQ